MKSAAVSPRSRIRLPAVLVTLALLAAVPLAACDHAEPLRDFVLPEPDYLVYDSTREPSCPWPEAYDSIMAAADALTPPLQNCGADTGEEGVLYAAVLGGYYLLRTQRPDGGFGYLYDYVDGTWADEDQIHRQCGATYTQALLLHLTGRPEFGVSTEWSLRRIVPMFEPQTDGSMKLIDIGATALSLLSLTTHSAALGDTSRDDLIEAAGTYLLAHITDEGRFTLGSSLQWGQTLSALTLLHKYTGDDRYLDALELGAHFLYEHPELTYEVSDEGYLMSLWVAEPLVYLHGERPLEWIPEYLFRLTDPIVASQYLPENTYDLEKMGCYICPEANGQATWRTALRLEGVADAMELILRIGDSEREAVYRNSILYGLYFLQGLQLRNGRTRDAAEPSMVEGAWPFTPTGDLLRADVTHHTSNTLLKAALILGIETFAEE